MVTFRFDPGCPWTWVTSRWLVGEAARRGTGITWRAFPLALSNDAEPPAADDPVAVGTALLRMIEHLRAEDRNAEIGALYTAAGEALHERGERGAGVVEAAVRSAGLDEGVLDAAGEDRWDAALRSSLDEARALVGDDVGSPIVEFDSGALFGPILSSQPSADDAARVWDAVETLAGISQVAELKRGRGIGVVLDPAVGG